MTLVVDEAEEKFFPVHVNPDPLIKPKYINPEELTLGDLLVITIKRFIKQHKKPRPVLIYGNERKNKLVAQRVLPAELIDLIVDYEISSTQKDYLHLKNWFLFYDNANRFVLTTRILLCFNLCLTSFPALILTGFLNTESNKTEYQIAVHVLSWIHIFVVFTALVMALLDTGLKTNCDDADYADRFDLLRALRDHLSIDLNKVSRELLYKSQVTTKNLLQRGTKPDSRLFLFILFILTPINAVLCILGLNYYETGRNLEWILLSTNTVSVGLAAFGLYKNNQKKELGESIQPSFAYLDNPLPLEPSISQV